MYKYIFLIQALVVGHLGWFHNVAILNNGAINTGVPVPWE
jgi:hypothetical protein